MTELKVDPLLLANTHEKYPPFLTCSLENYFVKRFLESVFTFASVEYFTF